VSVRVRRAGIVGLAGIDALAATGNNPIVGADEDPGGQDVARDLIEGAEPDSADSDIPQFHQLFREILNAFPVGETLRYGEVASSVADQIGLDAAARERRLPTGKSVFENRVQWGLTGLTKAELVELVARARCGSRMKVFACGLFESR
jgi:hypothetical protein